MSSKFDLFTEQPPTPPRDVSKVVNDAISFLDDSNEVDRLTSTASVLPTFNDVVAGGTPSLSQETTATAPGSRRVDFSPHLRYHKIAPAGQLDRLKCSPSKKDAKPRKSILKQTNAPPPTPEDLDTKLSYFSPEVPGSFTKMLQSVIQQLTGPSRSSRLDAYMTLNNVLRTYDEPPDATAMVEKMDVLMQFISRDMAWKGMDGKLDTQIVGEALNLTYSILSNRKLSEGLDDDFRTFLVDRSILVFEQPEMPKQIMKKHMVLVSSQKFRASTISPTKVDKLVTALQTVEERCSGNSIVTTRLVAYVRLFEQSPTTMLNRMPDWLHHVFHGMLSSIPEIRQRAIDTCMHGGIYLGTQAHAGKAMEEMFQNDNEDGQSYWTFFAMRMIEMINDDKKGVYVPQIWAAVALYFRSKRKPLEKWPKCKSWLSIMQRCFNSSNIDIRYQATLAWNKLSYIIMPDDSTSEPMLGMLPSPVVTALGSRGADRLRKQFKQYTIDSFYNTLHYTLRPGLSFEQYDRAWECVVTPVLSMMVNTSKGRSEICRMLHGLLSPNKGAWNLNAAFDRAAVKPEDLPRLEPKWVRSRLTKLLSLVEPVVGGALSQSTEAHSDVDSTWRGLMQCIRDAGSQEVKTTHDLKEAVALLVNFLRRMWKRGPTSNTTGSPSWIRRYTSLIITMLECLGATPFVEEILARTDSDDVEVAPTPSHRPSKHHSAPLSPMIILLGQFCLPPKGQSADDVYYNHTEVLLRRFITPKSTDAAKLELLSRTLHSWTEEHRASGTETAVEKMWVVVASVAIKTLQRDSPASPNQDSQSLGNCLRSGLDIYVKGLSLAASPDSRRTLSTIYDVLSTAAKDGSGDGGLAMAVMEPLAKALVESDASTELKLMVTSHMLGNVSWPKTRQAMEQARKALWGVGLPPHKASTFDPYDQVYSLIGDLMMHTYGDFAKGTAPSTSVCGDFVRSVVLYLRKAPLSLLPVALRKIQDGFVSWIEDHERVTCQQLQVAELVCTTWTSIIRLLQKLPSKDSNILKALEPLLVAGFASPHRSIVNATILFWNDTFGCATCLEYPATLETVLRARSADAQLKLPTFPESNEETAPASLPDFFESQSQSNAPPRSDAPPRTARASVPSPLCTAKSSPLRRPTSTASPFQRSHHSSGSLTPKARLRHNDSQVEFLPIESSPLQPNDESQLLTEHQKEVKARQQQGAQLFPDLSSSPIAQSTALPTALQKRIDFTSEVKRSDETGSSTPTGPPDTNVLPSDDIPSSPTPSSTRAASQGPLEYAEDPDDDALDQDPPSSPPRVPEQPRLLMDTQTRKQHEHDLDDITIDISDLAGLPAPMATNTRDTDLPDNGIDAEPELPTDEMISATEYPSDSQLPTVQLQMEAEDAAQRSVVENASFQIVNAEQSPRRSTRSSQKSPTKSPNSGKELEESHEDVSRIENSFLEATEEESQSTNPSQSQTSQKTSKKRKRAGIDGRPKKRTKQSPFKRIWSNLVGVNQEDDEDIGEEIVVASSQAVSSPGSTRVEQTTISPEKATERQSKPVGEPMKEEPGAMQPPPKRGPGRPSKSVTPTPSMNEFSSAPSSKRGRGRPRKSETPTPSVIDYEPAQSLMRRASTISNASIESSQAVNSLIKDTPAPNKATKLREEQESRRQNSSQSSQTKAMGSSPKKRKAVAVVIDDADLLLDDDIQSSRQSVIEENNQQATPEVQLPDEAAAAAVNDRKILTPRSILGRLRDALSDFRGMILGSQEEREFDDVLFELRRETHDAGRRGRGL